MARFLVVSLFICMNLQLFVFVDVNCLVGEGKRLQTYLYIPASFFVWIPKTRLKYWKGPIVTLLLIMSYSLLWRLLFGWRLVFIQVTMECYILLELVWRRNLKQEQVRPSVCPSLYQFVTLLKMPTPPLLTVE